MQEMVKFLDPYRKRKMAFVLLSMNEVELPQVQRDVSNQLKTQLELAIDKLGFIVPIVVVPNDDGKYLVIDGQHRFLAMQSLGAKEVTAIVVDKSLYDNILDFNTEKPPTIKDKAKQSYRLYTEFLARNPNLKEEDLANNIPLPCLITFGVILEEIDPKFPAGFYDTLGEKIDSFLDLPLEEAIAERRKRARALIELNNIVNEVYSQMESKDPLLKGTIIRKAIQAAYGTRARVIPDDFYTVIEKLKNACKTLDLSKED